MSTPPSGSPPWTTHPTRSPWTPETHRAYQITYFHALGEDGVDELIDRYYRAFFDSLSDATDTDHELDTYTGQQATPAYRTEFLRSLEDFDALRWWLASRTGCSRQRHGLALPTATSMP